MENPRRGGGSSRRGGLRGPGGCLRGIWVGAGAKFFFSGPKFPPRRKSFAILSLQVSRDMKSIAAGPLSVLSWLLPSLSSESSLQKLGFEYARL